MSASASDAATPIDPVRFTLAIHDLPIDALHSKAAEIRNSISHLRHSNAQMLPFADEGDQDCKEAMFENLTVIGRMNVRLSLLRQEVEMRGLPWSAEGEEGESEHEKTVDGLPNGVVGIATNGVAESRGSNGAAQGESAPAPRAPSGRLTDEELRRQLEAQLGVEDGEEGSSAGVHL